MIIGESERLILRTFKEDDIDDVMEFWGNPEVMKYCPGSSCNRAILMKTICKYKTLQTEKGHSVYAVEMKNSGKVIGGCGFNFTENDEVIELIYHFARDYWGKGFAYEAGKVAMKFISDNKKFKKVIASVLLENKSSENILKNIGFKFVEMKWFDDSQCFEPYYEYIFDEKISTIKT